MNAERPVGNRLAHELGIQRVQRIHHQRLRDIANGKLRGNLGNEWTRSKPSYRHVSENRKKAQLEAERYDAVERENRILLEKMAALMTGRSTLDPTEGTQEFAPGVRLTRTQRPVIDHAISHQPQMPGAARARTTS